MSKFTENMKNWGNNHPINEQRQKVCDECERRGQDKGGFCRQIAGPICHEEYEYMGACPKDIPNAETLRKLMEISLKPECMERLLTEHSLEWWLGSIYRVRK